MGWYFTKEAPSIYGMKERALSEEQLGEHKAWAEAGQGMHIDQWGRLTADPTKWPEGIKGAAQKLHALGIKMGIHIMRGINTAAVVANTPILDISTGKGALIKYMSPAKADLSDWYLVLHYLPPHLSAQRDLLCVACCSLQLQGTGHHSRYD